MASADAGDSALSLSQITTLNSSEQRLETAEIIEPPETMTENTTKLLKERDIPKSS